MTVWAAISGDGHILGPHFFDVNLNGETYLNMINELVVPEIMELIQYNLFGDSLFENYWFQDGAPAHGTINVRNRNRNL